MARMERCRGGKGSLRRCYKSIVGAIVCCLIISCHRVHAKKKKELTPAESTAEMLEALIVHGAESLGIADVMMDPIAEARMEAKNAAEEVQQLIELELSGSGSKSARAVMAKSGACHKGDNGLVCSGHGSCSMAGAVSGKRDFRWRMPNCTCFDNWMGSRCDQRVCPYGRAYQETPDPDGNRVWEYMECSGRGKCDRKTGICDCYKPHRGQACKFTACPKDCARRGRCVRRKTRVQADESFYHRHVCECDYPWTGADCTKRACPTGDDPMTPWKTNFNASIKITSSYPDLHGYFILRLKDSRGASFASRPIEYKRYVIFEENKQTASLAYDQLQEESTYVEKVKNSLLAIPNQMVTDVQVTLRHPESPHQDEGIIYDIGFPSGNWGEITIDTEPCDMPGCAPRTSGLYTAGELKTEISAIRGDRENEVCSNRGICNHVVGECQCFKGYSGVRCERQSTLV